MSGTKSTLEAALLHLEGQIVCMAAGNKYLEPKNEMVENYLRIGWWMCSSNTTCGLLSCDVDRNGYKNN